MKRRWLTVFALLVTLTGKAFAEVSAEVPEGVDEPEKADKCHGEFPDPVDAVCWDCVFPMHIGKTQVSGGDGIDPGGYPDPVCLCGARPGLGLTFWEPARVAEATTRPFCSPVLGGEEMADFKWVKGGTNKRDEQNKETFYHVHWMYFPLTSWFAFFTSAGCMSLESFDVGVLSELEPTWGDDELSMLMSPEAVLFSNPVLLATCAADCVAATTNLPFNWMFWCGGCQGGLYPMSGNGIGTESGLDAGLLAILRMHAKLHRALAAWDFGSKDSMCAPQPAFFIPKSHYKTQIIYPRPVTNRAYPYGAFSGVWGAGREYPVEGEDFAHIIWRRRVCCLY